MKNSSICAKRLSALLKKIGPVKTPVFPGMTGHGWAGILPKEPDELKAFPPGATDSESATGESGEEMPPDANQPAKLAGDPVAVLVLSMLLWESTTDKALAAYSRLMDNMVDFNDLRVCMSHETVELIGPRYPRALDRCQRLRAVLRNVYLREHAVNMDRLASTNRREIKKYIESLEGIVPYAAARLELVCFGIHAIPVDDQLRIHLIDTEIGDASIEIPELSHWLALHIKPAEGALSHYALQCWIDQIAGKSAEPKKPPLRKSPARKGPSRLQSRRSAKV